MKAFLIWLDDLADKLLLARRWETISARSWEARVKGKRWGYVAVSLIDAVFGQGHCERSAA